MFFLMDIFKNLFCFTGSYSNESFPEPLSSSDEEKYIKLKMNGDSNARNKLVEHNLRLVAHIIKKYESKFVSNDDLNKKKEQLSTPWKKTFTSQFFH